MGLQQAEELQVTGESIPKWLDERLSRDDAHAIGEKVRTAEQEVMAEFVPVIVRRSSAIGHVPLMLTLIVVCVELIMLLFIAHDVTPLHIDIAVGLALPIAIAIAWFMSRFAFVARALTADADELMQVRRRAVVEFARLKIARTSKHNGVLFFVSVMERKALILPDDELAQILTKEVCERIVNNMANDLSRYQWRQAFDGAISEAVAALKPSLARNEKASNLNELSNRLVISD